LAWLYFRAAGEGQQNQRGQQEARTIEEIYTAQLCGSPLGSEGRSPEDRYHQ
jgi:hypothetical protein